MLEDKNRQSMLTYGLTLIAVFFVYKKFIILDYFVKSCKIMPNMV